ncbi:MAG: tRNA (N(6)-L-threonylcarbamoyladenosine(37)-C(2))-methylthiotransferase MtaB [Pseudomonadota bacterium]
MPQPSTKTVPHAWAKAPTLITHGCRLNGYESEAMGQLGAEAGLGDAVVINTCAVTNNAVRDARAAVRRARREQPDAKVIVTGCAAQIDPDQFAAMPEVDGVLGNQEKLTPDGWANLATSLGQQKPETNTPAVLVNDIMAVRDNAPHLIDGYGDRARAFLQVQNGCDHRCTFCIIPYGRGNARSVPVDRVVEQARRLVDAGHKELVLTGVDITSYGPDLEGKPTLGALVSTLLDQVPDLFRLRLSSIDGAEIDEALFERITGDNRVAPYLHLSVQSGDDMILKRMKRRQTRAQAIDICARVRAARPDMAFGADIIAGFPTETEAMFENSVHLIEQAGLNFVHVFPYSAREGTPAARMPQVNGAVIKDRAARLRAAATSAKRRFLESLEGSDQVAIVESGNRARLGCFATVKLPGAATTMPPLTPGMLARLIVGPRDGDLVTTKTAPQVQENA